MSEEKAPEVSAPAAKKIGQEIIAAALPSVITTKPRIGVAVELWREHLLKMGKNRKELVIVLGGAKSPFMVTDIEEANRFAKEFVFLNARGFLKTPDPCDYFWKVHNFGVFSEKTRERLDGTDGETGAARRRGELPLPSADI